MVVNTIVIPTNEMYCEISLSMHVGILIQKYVIQPSFIPWSSHVVMMKKDVSWKFCVDYRKLNSVTHRDAYSVPKIP